MGYLLGCLRRDRERGSAFKALGQMDYALKDRMDLEPVLAIVRTNLQRAREQVSGTQDSERPLAVLMDSLGCRPPKCHSNLLFKSGIPEHVWSSLCLDLCIMLLAGSSDSGW